MHDTRSLFFALADDDQDWLLDVGVERQQIANSVIIKEGAEPAALFMVLEGLVSVGTELLGAQPLAQIGPGQVFGEMSFLEGEPAVADVIVLENSLLLEIPYEVLRKRVKSDPGFGTRFHGAIGRSVGRRLRNAVHEIGRIRSDARAIHGQSSEQWEALVGGVDAFKNLIAEADQEALESGGIVSDEHAAAIVSSCDQLARNLNDRLGAGSELTEEVRNDLGHRVQRELLPYVRSSEISERIYTKPRGYAGDYLTIAIMYDDVAAGDGRTGQIIDRAMRDQPACAAVRNRRGLLAEEIGKARSAASDRVTRVTSMASGPAAELFDVFAVLEDPTTLVANCIDIDQMALDFVRSRCEEEELSEQFELHAANLVYLSTGRRKIDLPPQDLVYSIGLIDYFNDRFVVRLLNYVHSLLKPHGRVILGNFHVDNPSRALMDYVLDWKLIHRTEDDMHRLFSESEFGRGCTNIRYEATGVNLFAECIKRG